MQLLLLWLRGGIRTHDLTGYEPGGGSRSPTPHLTGWCPWRRLARPESYKDPALPTELHGHDPSRLCPHAMTRQAESPLHAGAAAPAHMPTRPAQCLCTGTPESDHGADAGVRTRGLDRGMVARYQLRHIRNVRGDGSDQFRPRLALTC